jgi:hypothetical protein
MLNQCLNLLKREDVKQEVKQILVPFLDILLDKWKPYIWTGYFLLLLNLTATSLLLFQLQKKYFLR